MVVEIKPTRYNKASAVEISWRGALCGSACRCSSATTSPDYDGFAAVRRLDGLSVAVGDRVSANGTCLTRVPRAPGWRRSRAWRAAMTGERPQPLSLAVIGNCEVSALIDARGCLVWMCLPRPDGDPVFSALLTPALGDTPRASSPWT